MLSYSHSAARGAPPELQREAQLLRRDIVDALHASGGGHYGGSLSVVDILLTLYRSVLRVSPASVRDPLRDRLILSKGHAAVALYAVLRRLGFSRAPLSEYASYHSPLEGHPDMHALPGVDFSTGSLGQGLSVGSGMALALREHGAHVWVILGDGECQEGQNWEAAQLASRLRLANLHVVVDSNGFQESGWSGDHVAACAAHAPPVPDLAAKWRSFGWDVHESDGHDHALLGERFHAMSGCAALAPSAVIAHTVKGKGFPSIEADPLKYHCASLTDIEHAQLVQSP
jgi:transketolase